MQDIQAASWWRSTGLSHRESGADSTLPELVDWLRSGGLQLVHPTDGLVGEDQWSTLPASTRSAALEEFRRIVAKNTRAAILPLRM